MSNSLAAVHLLETLCFEGYAQKMSSNGEYMLGPEAYLLTRFGKYNENLISLCHPVLLYLAKKLRKRQCWLFWQIIKNSSLTK